jgi:hypothetical protein
VSVPDCETSHLDLGTCLSQLEAVFLNGEIVGLEYSPTVAAGAVISQSPAPASEQEEGTTIDLVISRGGYKSRRGIGFGMGVRP